MLDLIWGVLLSPGAAARLRRVCTSLSVCLTRNAHSGEALCVRDVRQAICPGQSPDPAQPYVGVCVCAREVSCFPRGVGARACGVCAPPSLSVWLGTHEKEEKKKKKAAYEPLSLSLSLSLSL